MALSRRTLAVLGGIALVVCVAGVIVAGSTAAAATSHVSCTASPTEVNPGESVTLDASATPDNVTFVEFDVDGDGEYEETDETDFVVSWTYEATGTYNPVARAGNDPDSTDSCGEIVVQENQPPSADLQADPNPAQTGETVTLDASGSTDSDGNVIFYEWDVDGDGNYEAETEIGSYDTSYAEAGSYNPTVRVSDDDGATDTATIDLTVSDNQPPSPDLQLSPNPASAGETVTLNASGSFDEDGEIVQYRWDFDGDGTVEAETEFATNQFMYSTPGNYVPSVTVVDDEGATATATRDLVVEENAQPSAALQISPSPAEVGESVTFDASNSSDADGEIVEYRWDYNGNGTVESVTTDPLTTFVFEDGGSKFPRVTVVDDVGATDTAEADLFVEQPSNAVCEARPTNVGVDETVTLDASASSASFVEFDVDGDGEYERGDETDFIVNVTYAEEGTYTPVARADNDPEATDPCGEITVSDNEPPNPEFTISPRPGVVGQAVSFDASGSSDPDGTIVEYRWDFDNDGSFEQTVTSPTTQFTYGAPGSYVPELVVVDDEGATGRTSRDFAVERRSRAVCRAEPTTIAPGGSVILDASESDAAFVEFDVDGDGEYEEGDETDFIVNVTYEEPGTYTPVARADNDPEATDPCGEIVVEENQPPEPEFSVDPRPGLVGQAVSFDASASSDPDGQIVEYRWDFDGDGNVEQTNSGPMAEFTYSATGGYAPRLTVVDDDGATASISGDLVVEQPRSLVCRAEPTEVETNETVTLDASDSEGVPYVEFDVDGDGEYEEGDETDLVVETSYAEEGTYTPMARAGAEGEAVPCGEIVVEDPDSGGIPLGPIGIGGGGILGLGLLYYFLGPGGAGGGGGGGGSTPKPKPKPGLGGDEDPRYETGVFEIPESSGKLAVSVGFEPDLIFFSATNAARTDAATDRTAGWSRGMAFSRGETLKNYSLTVADDAQTTDQATCAADDDTVLKMIRHGSDQPPGRVRLAVDATTTDGFEVDVGVPGNDPFASGIRVHYQAIKLGSGVEADLGTFMTPTEPGTQVVDLGFDADHVSLLGSAAVTDIGRLWTTDRGVAMTGGHAALEGQRVDQAAWGASAWPRSGHDSAAVTAEGGLNLLYQDGKELAGRTRAEVADIGSQLRLRYDRVYNGPHKLGSTARHVVSYLAMNGGETMRPAVGAAPMPGPEEQLQVDCGFEPAMIEVTVSGAPLGEEVPNWAAPQPFGWSEGTAIADEGGLRQYVLHHAFTPAPRAGTPSAETGVGGEATADRGASTDGGQPPAGSGARSEQPVSADADDLAAAGEVTPAVDLRADPAAQSPAPEGGGDAYRVRHPAEVPDDGLVGISMLQDDEGTVVGRDECRIAALTSYGFDLSVDRVAADGAPAPAERPTLIYRAWPAPEQTGGDRTDQPSGEGTTTAESSGGNP